MQITSVLGGSARYPSAPTLSSNICFSNAPFANQPIWISQQRFFLQRSTMSPQSESALGRGTSHTAVSLRKAKKREADRKSQQAARERTKNRMAFLEALVLDFEQQDPTKNTKEHLRQLDEVRAERDSLEHALSSIERIIKGRKRCHPAPSSVDSLPRENQSTPPPENADNSGFGDIGDL